MAQRVVLEQTGEGVLLPTYLVAELGEVEAIRFSDHIVIRPVGRDHTEQIERSLDLLHAAGLLLEKRPLEAKALALSSTTRRELAQKYAQGTPLSTLVDQDREERG